MTFQDAQINEEDIERTIMAKAKHEKPQKSKNAESKPTQSKKLVKSKKTGKTVKGIDAKVKGDDEDDTEESKTIGSTKGEDVAGKSDEGEDAAETASGSSQPVVDEYEFDSSDEEVS